MPNSTTKTIEAHRIIEALELACDESILSMSRPIREGNVLCATNGHIAVRFQIPTHLSDAELWKDCVSVEGETNHQKNFNAITTIIARTVPSYALSPDATRTLYSTARSACAQWMVSSPTSGYAFETYTCPCCGTVLKMEDYKLEEVKDDDPLVGKRFELEVENEDSFHDSIFVSAERLDNFMRMAVGIHCAAVNQPIEKIKLAIGKYKGAYHTLIAEGESFKAICIVYKEDFWKGRYDADGDCVLIALEKGEDNAEH